MKKEDQLAIAAAALGRLESLHADFMATVSGLEDLKVNGVEFGIAKAELFAVCLGVRLNAPHRFIAREGAFTGIEYTFQAEHDGKTLPIWSIYLLPNQRLYLDSSKENVVCDASNKYLSSRIAPLLASALLASPKFMARA